MPKQTNIDLESLAQSGIRRFALMAQETSDCVSLTIGEPEFATPTNIVQKVSESLERGKTHYPPNDGYIELREALSAYMAKSGLSYGPGEIAVTVGASEALACALQALINPGDEVIIPVPAFSLYESIVVASHGVVVPLDTTSLDFQIDTSALKGLITDKTKALILTSPNNPTGCLYSKETLDVVGELAKEYGFYVVCDDVYNRLCFGEYERFALLHQDLRDQIVVIDSFSKPWAMTGWRLGWFAAPGALFEQIEKMHQYLVSCVPAFLQDAAIEALSTPIDEMKTTYARRRSYVYERLCNMGLDVVEPQGAFYAFPSIKKFGMSSEEFCERAIKESGVALVPGTAFGTEGYVRLSYCCSDALLSEALDRLESFIAKIQ